MCFHKIAVALPHCWQDGGVYDEIIGLALYFALQVRVRTEAIAIDYYSSELSGPSALVLVVSYQPFSSGFSISDVTCEIFSFDSHWTFSTARYTEVDSGDSPTYVYAPSLPLQYYQHELLLLTICERSSFV